MNTHNSNNEPSDEEVFAWLFSAGTPNSCKSGECRICGDFGWVCEDHPDKVWDTTGCKCGAGMPCVCIRDTPTPHAETQGET